MIPYIKYISYYHFPEVEEPTLPHPLLGITWPIQPVLFSQLHGCNASIPHLSLNNENQICCDLNKYIFSALNHSLNEVATSIRFYEFFCLSGFHLTVASIGFGLSFVILLGFVACLHLPHHYKVHFKTTYYMTIFVVAIAHGVLQDMDLLVEP